MKRSLDQLAEVARKAVGIGHDLVKYSRPKTVTEKTDRDTYTDVDIYIERKVSDFLGDVCPEIGFHGEEGGRSNRATGSEFVWVLDPIDGTANYVHGIPLCAVQIALMNEDRAVVAAISLPYMNMHYWAIEGRGAYANNTRIRVSTTDTLSKSIVSLGDYATGEGAAAKNIQRIRITAALAERVERIRMFGSAAHDLVWLAEGRTDAAVILSNKPWDLAAGVLVAREAGALVSDDTGADHSISATSTIAAASGVATEVVQLVQTVVQQT